jgi:membrane associated rhomboid family serine protease
MIPINDSQGNRYTLFPLMNTLLIVANTLVFFWEMGLPRAELYRVFYVFGATPADIWNREGAGIISTFTSMFLHADFYHLLSNMLFLWVFGRRVEDACGPLRYLFYYLLSGAMANMLTAFLISGQDIPGIGASGAIFGVTGAYLILYPGGRIRTFIFIISFIAVWPRIRAFWILMYYILIQIPPAIITLITGASFGIGYWAHIGGFITCLVIPLFLRPDAFARFISDRHSISIE